MNYQRIYSAFIENRKSKEVNGYYEAHHIMPRSLNGSDDKSNIIKLSARDHFFAHLLLARFAGNKMKIALQYMLYGKTGIQKQNRHKPSSRIIGVIIENANKARSEMLTGRTFTESHRKNLSIALAGRKAHNKNKPISDKQRKKQSESMQGKNPWNKGITGDEYLEKYKDKPKPPNQTGYKWINNGIKQTKLPPNIDLPIGWSYGRIDMMGNNNPARKKNDI